MIQPDKPAEARPPYPPNYRDGFGVPDVLEIDDDGNAKPFVPGPGGTPRKSDPEYKPDRPVREPRAR